MKPSDVKFDSGWRLTSLSRQTRKGIHDYARDLIFNEEPGVQDLLDFKSTLTTGSPGRAPITAERIAPRTWRFHTHQDSSD